MSKRPGPVPVRFPPHDLAAIDAARGKTPRGTYIRECVVGKRARPNASVWAQILALLGRIADSLRRIAAALEAIAELEPEDRAALRQAWADIAAIKSLLMRALRVKED